MRQSVTRVGMVAAALAVWLSVRAPLIAQPMVVGWIDAPSDGAEVSREGFSAGGWVFRCDTGAFPEAASIAFFNRDTQAWYFPASWNLYEQLYRPDVHAAFTGACPNVGDYTGYSIAPAPPPPGHWDMYITWATYDGGQWSDHREVTIAGDYARPGTPTSTR